MFCRDIPESEVHLHMFMKNFNFPPDAVCFENLGGRRFQVAACNVFAASAAFFLFDFGAYRCYFSDTLQKNFGMSYAEILPLIIPISLKKLDWSEFMKYPL